ncbi:MAG: hypothetical protein HC892_23030 [Saprospiraceae bacterium]|nr:hypothetical protein [Saprospiraceae bacterium]
MRQTYTRHTSLARYLLFGILTILFAFTSVQVANAQSCNCKEYIYFNEPAIGAVLKFEVGSSILLTELIGANGGTPPNQHWYPGLGTTALPLPHGLGTDLNGRLYIADRISTPSTFRQLDCDGNISPITPTTVVDTEAPTFNAFSIGNTLIKRGIMRSGLTTFVLGD